MFSPTWQTSPRLFGVTIERNLRIPIAPGAELGADIFRPDAPGRFPALLMISPYDRAEQSMEMVPEFFPGNDGTRGSLEVGDFNFFVRRGYVFVIANLRGTGDSALEFGNINPDADAIADIARVIDWLAAQTWCDGRVAMNGVSYFSVVQKRTAAVAPPALRALFSMYGWTDGYRDGYYRGGILSHGFATYWLALYARGFRFSNRLREQWGEARYRDALEAARADRDLMAVPAIAAALRDPENGINMLIAEIALNPLYNEYHQARAVDFTATTTLPAYLGADWGNYGLHLAGDVRAYQEWRGPKKLTIGPPIYLDRPLYQYAHESLRWFDHWLKDIDTGLLDEPRVNLFLTGADDWVEASDWPLPGTRFTPFHLHAGGLLSEHEHWPNEGSITFEDSPFGRGGVAFRTPEMVETTDIAGPIAAKIFASSTDSEILWFASLWHVARDGSERLLTRGWLRGSQRELDAQKSRPWQPYHTHARRDPLVPGEITEFDLELRPYGIRLHRGERLKLLLKCADNDPPTSFLERLGLGSITRQAASHVTIQHNAAYPSYLLLPVIRGNRIGTFLSGGRPNNPAFITR